MVKLILILPSDISTKLGLEESEFCHLNFKKYKDSDTTIIYFNCMSHVDSHVFYTVHSYMECNGG